ncbi:MAG: DUF805 domain-containing protein [Sphingorhabdus sp.]
MKFIFLPFTRIADYKGRSGRREYWLFQLLKIIIGALLSIVTGLASALMSAPLLSGNAVTIVLSNTTTLIIMLAYLFVFLPAEIALTVRRWHDIGNSGWTIVIIIMFGMIPLIGFLAWIVNFAAMCWPGDKGSNHYGPPPTNLNSQQPAI